MWTIVERHSTWPRAFRSTCSLPFSVWIGILLLSLRHSRAYCFLSDAQACAASFANWEGHPSKHEGSRATSLHDTLTGLI